MNTQQRIPLSILQVVSEKPPLVFRIPPIKVIGRLTPPNVASCAVIILGGSLSRLRLDLPPPTMILIAQPHTGLPPVEKRLRPTPTRTDSLESRASADVATERTAPLFIQPSPPPYVLPTSSTDRSRSGGKRKTSRDVCRAVCGIFAAFIIGLSGALICIWLYWEGFSEIVGRKKVGYIPRLVQRQAQRLIVS